MSKKSEIEKRQTYSLLTENSCTIQKEFGNISEALLKMGKMISVI